MLERIKVTQEVRNLPLNLEIPVDQYVVFVGPNNSGKSAILAYLNTFSPQSQRVDLVSPARFQAARRLEPGNNPEEMSIQARGNRKNIPADNNLEPPAPDPTHEIFALSDAERAALEQWFRSWMGEIRISRTNPANSYSASELSIEGRPIVQQGTGWRSVLSLLCRLFDSKIDLLLVDEPEAGLEPRMQRRLASVLQAASLGQDGIPKKKIILSTHSHIFLDHEHPERNFLVDRDEHLKARITQLRDERDLQRVVFRLLGNSPRDLFFPENIVVVEGASDATFVERILTLLKIGSLAIHYVDGDSNVDYALPAIDQMLKSLSYLTMYRERLCVLVDAQADKKRVSEWKKYLQDDAHERVLDLPKNGIEWYYPASVMTDVTGLSSTQLETELPRWLSAVKGYKEVASLGKFKGGKVSLAKAVADLMSTASLNEVDSAILNLLKVADRKAIRPEG